MNRTYREGKIKRQILREQYKNRTFEQVLTMVRNCLIIHYRPIIVADTDPVYQIIRKEDIAGRLKVKIEFVERALQVLNIEGMVSQPEHGIPHDCDRDRIFGGVSAWCADIYRVCGSYWTRSK